MPAVAEEADAILQDVRAIIAAVAFVDIAPANIKIRELPKVGEVLDVVPGIFICLRDDLGSEPLDMEGNANRIHHVEICLVDGMEGDYATDRAKRQKWHKQTLNAMEFEADGSWRLTLPSVPSVWSIRPSKAPTVDRAKLADNYAYQSVVMDVLSQE